MTPFVSTPDFLTIVNLVSMFLRYFICSVVLGLDISDASIGVSYANHPSPTNEVHILDTIPYVAVDNKCGLERLKQKARVADALDDIVNDLKVRAFVVGLPLQPDGRMGGPCGKVLHFLDYLAGER
jgi:RNase H-fold protein (predicted Holliday junction resolvase)